MFYSLNVRLCSKHHQIFLCTPLEHTSISSTPPGLGFLATPSESTSASIRRNYAKILRGTSLGRGALSSLSAYQLFAIDTTFMFHNNPPSFTARNLWEFPSPPHHRVPWAHLCKEWHVRRLFANKVSEACVWGVKWEERAYACYSWAVLFRQALTASYKGPIIADISQTSKTAYVTFIACQQKANGNNNVYAWECVSVSVWMDWFLMKL